MEIESKPAVERITKSAPHIAHALGEIEKYVDPQSIPMILDAAQAVRVPYLGWETVRKLSSQSIIGDATVATGAEGWFYQIGWDPQDIMDVQAEIGQQELDTHVRYHPHQLTVRREMEQFLHGEQVSNLRVINDLFPMFTNIRNACKQISQSYPGLNERQKFKQHTTDLVRQLPAITYRYEHGQLTQTYELPLAAQHGSCSGFANPSNIPHRYQDGWELVSRIGILGHPVLFLAEQTPIIRALLAASKSYLPPQGTSKRLRLTDDATLKLITQLQSYR